MTAAAGSARRRRWSPLLIAVLLVLLTLAAVVTAQLYWSGLRTGVAQMRTSVATAQQEQRRLLARLQTAEAALAKQAAAMDTAADDAPAEHRETTSDGVAVGASAAPWPHATASLRDRLSAAERAALATQIEALAREAARLPPGWSPRRPRAATSKQLLRDQLAVAAAAVTADDPVLLDAALLAAQRLTDLPYRVADRRGAIIAAELAALRARLRTVARPPPARVAPEPAQVPRAGPPR